MGVDPLGVDPMGVDPMREGRSQNIGNARMLSDESTLYPP